MEYTSRSFRHTHTHTQIQVHAFHEVDIVEYQQEVFDVCLEQSLQLG